MPVAATVIGIGGALLGGNQQANTAKNAARAQTASADAATAEQRRQFDIIQQNQAPGQQIGTEALNKLASLYGIGQYQAPAAGIAPGSAGGQPLSFDAWKAQNPQFSVHGGLPSQIFAGATNQQKQYQNYLNDFHSQQAQTNPNPPGGDGSGAAPAAGAPDYSAFYNSPDYAFALDQGNQSLQRSAAAGGNLASGNTLAAAQQYGQGLATQNYGNYVNRLAGLAGIGQNANNAVGQAALQTGANVGNSLMAAGNARASGIVGAGNAWGNALGSIATIGGDYFGRKQIP